MNKDALVEIARSFSYKLNVGNYESRDFFCSQKAEVPESEAEKTSELLYQFCKNEVMKSVEKYIASAKPKEKMSKYERREKVAPRGEDLIDELPAGQSDLG